MRIATASAAAASVLLLAACAAPQQIAEQATKGNLGVEDSNNQVLVLNTLRASKRRPLYFTALTTFNGPLGTASPTIGFNIPFGGGHPADAFQPSWKVDVPQFSLGSLDTAKFIQGITKPVSPSSVKYYLEQGWPKQLLLSLLIREITYDIGEDVKAKDRSAQVKLMSALELDRQPSKKADRTTFAITNYPGDRQQFNDFQDELHAMIACGLRLVTPEETVALNGPSLTFKDTNASELISAAKEKIALKKVDGEWFLAKAPTEVKVALDMDRCAGLAKTKPLQYQRLKLFESGKLREAPQSTPEEKKAPSMTLYVRSPEAIIYYLGEIARAQLDGDMYGRTFLPVTRVHYSDQIECSEYIYKLNKEPSKDTFVTVPFDGQQYSVNSVPAKAPCAEADDKGNVKLTHDIGDRSSHALSLVSQLIGLQKDSGDIPQTTVIRAITQ